MGDAPIYMDHHATTPVDERVVSAMLPYFTEHYGNASSRVHAHGRRARKGVEAARAQVAGLIDASPDEIVFTSGATESDNLALFGTASGRMQDGKHLVSICTEHKAVLDSLATLEQRGWDVTRLPVDANGLIALEDLEAALTEQTTLVSVMLANNEVGVVQDLAAVAALTKKRGIILHCDAAQGLGYLPMSVRDVPVDLLSMSAHKMYGPKGVGALYVRRSLQTRRLVEPQMHGGGHQGGLRSGTLDVPGIVGMGAAADLMVQHGTDEAARIADLRDQLQARLVDALDDVRVNGSAAHRHPGNLNVSFGYVDGAALLLAVCETVSVSSGSACSSETSEPSYVLDAMGVAPDWAKASIRFGLGRSTTPADVSRAADAVVAEVEKLRAESPAWAAKQRGETLDW